MYPFRVWDRQDNLRPGGGVMLHLPPGLDRVKGIKFELDFGITSSSIHNVFPHITLPQPLIETERKCFFGNRWKYSSEKTLYLDFMYRVTLFKNLKWKFWSTGTGNLQVISEASEPFRGTFFGESTNEIFCNITPAWQSPHASWIKHVLANSCRVSHV